MKKTLILLALAGFAAAACGDDGDDKGTETPKPDASTGTKTDSGVVSRGVQVSNVGAACTQKSDCQGASATCETEIGMDEDTVELKGGYCSAQCNVSDECGAEGACPVAEITAGLPDIIKGFAGQLGGIVPSNCYKKCTAGAANACRDGYECSSFKELLPANIPAQFQTFLSGPAFTQTYCFPPVEITLPGDAGVPDAGATIKPTGMDAGV